MPPRSTTTRSPRNTPAGAFSGALVAALLCAAPAAAQETPYAATSRGAQCALQPDGTLTCRYRVGRDLEFTLYRVAQPDVSLEIACSDPEGDYDIEPTLQSRCVVVRYGKRAMAIGGSDFVIAAVSGRNGMVYRSLRECRLGR
jgi:hypothetical protein